MVQSTPLRVATDNVRSLLNKKARNIMTMPGRNDPCHCGSGRKYKKCCAAKMQQPINNLKPGIRMKGGISEDPFNGYRAIVHSWDNTECNGLPEE